MKNRKLLAFVFVMVLCAALTVFASAAIEVEIGSATYEKSSSEQTIDIPITLSGNTTGFTGIGVIITYGDGLVLTKVDGKTSDFSDLDITPGNDLTANPFKITWDTLDTVTGNGNLATLKFTVPANATKDYPIEIAVNSLYDFDMNDLEYTVTNGKIAIKKQDMKNVTFKSATKEFNAQTQNILVAGAPAGATVAYTVNGDKFDGARNVGEYAIKAVVTCEGYNDLTLNATLKITPKELTVENLKVEDKEYDGTTKATWTGELKGLLAGTDVTDHTIRVEFDEAKANDKADYSVNLSMSGDYVMNYTFTPFKRTAKITPKVITVTADAKDKVVGEADPELTYTYTPELIGDDAFTGALTRDAGEVGDKTYAIKQGTLALNANYKIVFVPAVLTINTKLIQNITVSEITDKTYGDEGFKVTVTPDATSKLEAFTFASSDENVATIDAEGNVVIKNAGTTVITVTEAGDDIYAKFEKKQTLNVKKVPVTVTARSYTKKINKADPAFEYDYVGTLIGNDAFTGELKRAEGEAVGTYDINIGTLTLGNNYEITFNKGVLTIVEKDPQEITVTAVTDKTYGDADFTIEVTEGTLVNAETTTTFTSLDTDVVTVDADGKVTVVGVGEATIEVKRAGNADLADFAETLKFNVNKKDVTITSANLDDKTAVLEGVVEGDDVTADFTNIILDKGEAVDDTTVNVTIKGIVLVGTDIANYNLVTLEVPSTIAIDNIATVTVVTENGEVIGVGSYIKLSTITLVAVPNKGYKLDAWFIGEEEVCGETEYEFTIDTDIELIVKFKRKPSSEEVTPVTPTYTVKFVSNGTDYMITRVLEGGKVKEFEAPKSNTAEFIGWYLDAAFTTPYTFATAIKADTTIYAKWSDSVPGAPATPETPDTPDAWTNPYIDVKESDWHYASVEAATKQGLMNGMTANEFAPNATLTRAMLATILYRLAGSPEVTAEAKFADVAVSDWYAKAVTWAAANGIVNGVGDNKFDPNANITREQMATMLYRYAAFAKVDTAVSEDKTTNYSDVAKISAYATDAFKWAVANGIINGDTTTTLSPEKNATRAQATALIVRFSELVK